MLELVYNSPRGLSTQYPVPVRINQVLYKEVYKMFQTERNNCDTNVTYFLPHSPFRILTSFLEG